jgi:hypothetical protein
MPLEAIAAALLLGARASGDAIGYIGLSAFATCLRTTAFGSRA